MAKCGRIGAGDPERYVLGELSEAEREAFETHYLQCADCLDELERYRDLQTTLQQAAPSIRAEPFTPAARRQWVWGAAAVSAVAVIGFAIWLRTPTPEWWSSPGAARVPQELLSSSGPSLEELARVVPPPYTPANLRGATTEASERFREAMERYLAEDYEAAITGRRAANELNPGAPDVAFFLGICHLLTGETDVAIERLQETVAFGPSPYLEEAHFYLAKAHLRTGDLDAAGEELRTTVQLRGELESEAQELLGRLETLGESSGGREGPVPDGAERP